jgi:DNA-binding transcriptional MerR regulator
VSSRSYLSIGDVLTLLRQEFPDVTISKIRFLESQGLVNPERTPSGYRKFYEHDVERLRWVLRQQRENFLPLKVIKDRLDDDANGAGSETPAPSGKPQAGTRGRESDRAAEAVTRDEPVLVGQRATSSAGAASTSSTSSTARGASRGGASLPGIESTRSAGRAREPATSRAEAATAGISATGAGTRAPSERAPEASHAAVTDLAAAKRPVSRPPRPGAAAGTAANPRRVAGERARGPAGEAQAAHAAEEAVESVDAPPAGAHRSEAGGASLSLEELSAACGLHDDVLRELQEYGLLVATPVAGLDYFDQEALAVATVAAGFARFGVEPRHLRLYKNAADREAGFVEQIVLPLVRQRNPDARAKAHQSAQELAGLGQQLRASLLRVALRGLLDG